MMHRIYDTLTSLCLRIDHVRTILLKDRNEINGY